MAPNQQEQAFELAKDMLKGGNSLQFGDTKKHLISVLESTNGSLSLGQKVGEFFKTLDLITLFGLGPITSLPTGFEDDKFYKYQKIEEKIAYLVSLVFNSTNTANLTTDNKTKIQTNIGLLLEKIKEKLSQDEDIKESDVVKLTALKNIKISLTREEENKLNDISKKIKKLLKDNDLENSFGEMSELPAQRIQKLKTTIILLEQKGLINADTQASVSDFKSTYEVKLKVLNEFNEEYFKLDNARTIFYGVDAKYGKIQVLDTKKQEKLEEVMKELGVDSIDTYLDTLYGQLGVTDINQAKHKILEKELAKLKGKSNFRKSLREKKLKQVDFEKNYLSYFSLQLIEKARENFYSKKEVVFGDDVENYDEEINNWRKVKRDKIISLQTVGDKVSLQKIFNNDSKVFFEIEGDTSGDNNKVKLALRSIIDNQYKNPAFDKEERDSIYNHILNRNNSNSILYYGKKKELDEDKLKRQEKTLSCLSAVGKTGTFLNKKIIFPSLKRTTKAFGMTVSTLIGKGVFGTIAKTSVGVENILKKTNAKITKKPKTWWGKILKASILPTLILTKPLELLGTASNWTGGEAVKGLKIANDWNKNIAKKWSNNEVDSISQWIVAGGISKGLLGWGAGNLYEKKILQKYDDRMSREQKEGVIADFYDKLADGKTSDKVSRILAGLDVAQKVNDSHPYIFDKVEEGVEVTDKTKEEKEKLSKDTLEKMLEQITKIKGNIALEKTSPNKYISPFMTQLEVYFTQIEGVINGKGKFEDKFDDVKGVISKLISYLGKCTVYPVSPTLISGTASPYTSPTINPKTEPKGEGELLTLMKKKYKNETKIKEYEITNADTNNRIGTPLSGASANVISAQNSLQQTITSNNEKIDKIEEENLVLDQAISKIDRLTNTAGNNFSSILSIISTKTPWSTPTTPPTITTNNGTLEELNYYLSNYDKNKYELSSKNLMGLFKSIDIS